MKARFGKDVVVYAAADLFGRGIQLLALPIYTQFLSVAEFGQLSLLTVAATLLAILVNIGVNNAVQRFYYEDGNERSTIIVSTGLIQLLASIIIFYMVIGFAYVFTISYEFKIFEIERYLFLLAFAYILPDQVAQYCQDVLRLQFSASKFFFVALVRGLIGILIGIALLETTDLGVSAVLLGTIAGACLAVPVGLYCIRSNLSCQFEKAASRKLLQYGAPFIVIGASYWIFQSMDRWMLAGFSGVTEVGLFSVANKFAVIVSFATFAFNRAWSPYAFYIHANETEYRQIIAKVLSIWLFFIAYVAFVISIFSNEILFYMTPREYWSGASILSIMCASAALEGTTVVTLIGISIAQKTSVMTLGTWISAIINVLLNLILLPRYGAVGAAISSLMAYVFLSLFFLIKSQELHPVPLEKTKLYFGFGLVILVLIVPILFQAREINVVTIILKFIVLLAVLAIAFLTKILDFQYMKLFFFKTLTKQRTL